MAGLEELGAAFDQLQISYLVGGSLAASARGVPRATFDIDILAAITVPLAERLAAILGATWYAETPNSRRPFNLLRIPSAEKFNIFPVTSDFHRSELQRARLTKFEHFACPVATAEDILIAKLQRYRDGGEVSDRQWSDIRGIAARGGLDQDYLAHWADELGVAALLEKALAPPNDPTSPAV